MDEYAKRLFFGEIEKMCPLVEFKPEEIEEEESYDMAPIYADESETLDSFQDSLSVFPSLCRQPEHNNSKKTETSPTSDPPSKVYFMLSDYLDRDRLVLHSTEHFLTQIQILDEFIEQATGQPYRVELCIFFRQKMLAEWYERKQFTSLKIPPAVHEILVDKRDRTGNRNVFRSQRDATISAFEQNYHSSLSLLRHDEWKIAFSAIMQHLIQYNSGFQVFPCGSMARGGVYTSVIDILVSYEDDQDSCSETSPPAQLMDEILTVLQHAKILPQPADGVQLPHRYIGRVQYKDRWVLLDLKVYLPPRSWFAVTYFTGPENFVLQLFRQLVDSDAASIKQLYQNAVKQFGVRRLSQIESEEDVFELMQQPYRHPSARY